MKCVLILFLSLVFSASYGQADVEYYITLNNDTVICDILPFSPFHKELNVKRHIKAVKFVLNGKKDYFHPLDIKGYSFVFDGERYNFFSFPYIRKNFFHEIVSGKIGFYYLYYSNTYDGSMVIHRFIVKGEVYSFVSIFNAKKKLAMFLEDCPGLYQEWQDENKCYKKLEEYIRKYNEVLNCKNK